MNNTPSTILGRLVRRCGLIVVLAALGAGAGGIYAAKKTATFRAQAYVVFTADPGEPTAAVTFAQAYGRIVTGGPVADAAAATLGFRKGLSRVTAATSPDAPVIEITATGTDAKRTADVANAVAKALVDYATARKAATRVSASVLAAATTPTAPSSPKPPLELVVGAAAGVLLGGLAALAGVGRTRRDGRTAHGPDLLTINRAPPGAASATTALVPLPPPASTTDPAPAAIALSAPSVGTAVDPSTELDHGGSRGAAVPDRATEAPRPEPGHPSGASTNSVAVVDTSVPGPEPASAWSVEVRRDDAALAEVQAEWNDLFGRCATATPFQAHAWLTTWWRTYGRPGRLRLVLVRLNGRLVAAAALWRERRWLCSVLTPVGGDLSDFADVLVDDALAEPAAQALADALAQLSGWQVVDLPETRPASVAGTLLTEAWRGRHRVVAASRCLELPARDLADVVAELPSHARKTVRRRVNQIRKLDLTVRVVTAHEADRTIGDLLALHTQQWQGRRVNPQHLRAEFAQHLGAAVPEMIRDGQAELFEYHLEGRLVAVSLALVGRDFVGGYLYGAEPTLRDRLDLTTLLLGDALALAVRRGCPTMSMLRGDEAYKLRWRPTESVNRRVLLVRRASPRARLYAAGVRVRRAAVVLVKRHRPGAGAARDRLQQRDGDD